MVNMFLFRFWDLVIAWTCVLFFIQLGPMKKWFPCVSTNPIWPSLGYMEMFFYTDAVLRWDTWTWFFYTDPMLRWDTWTLFFYPDPIVWPRLPSTTV